MTNMNKIKYKILRDSINAGSVKLRKKLWISLLFIIYDTSNKKKNRT
jgi:hypothetical protein